MVYVYMYVSGQGRRSWELKNLHAAEYRCGIHSDRGVAVVVVVVVVVGVGQKVESRAWVLMS